MKVYVSGPITGVPWDELKPSFEEAKQNIKSIGGKPVSPLDEENLGDWTSNMRHSIQLMMDCDVIYLMPGWQDSVGCTIERQLAENVNMPCIVNLEDVCFNFEV